jgi:hypothetical protein
MFQKNIITLIPTGGLCNRMRSIAAAYALARDVRRRLKVIWIRNSELGAFYTDLFEPPANFELTELGEQSYSERLIARLYAARSTGWKGALICKIRKYYYALQYNDDDLRMAEFDRDHLASWKDRSGNILIISCKRFFWSDNYLASLALLRPRRDIRDYIYSITGLWKDNIIGVHVRRADSKESISRSPLEAFEKIMSEELARDPAVRFFVSSDEESTIEHFTREFGQYRIMTRSRILVRDSLAGMKDACVDLFILAATKKIIGSYYSSFSEIAAEIGGIPMTTALR